MLNPPNAIRVTSLGNAGFLAGNDSLCLAIDPLFCQHPLVPAVDKLFPERVAAILVTHGHWDHFNARETAALAESRGAIVAGPRHVARELLSAGVPKERVIEMEPAAAGAAARQTIAGLDVTAFRTRHGAGHNSYLVRLGNFRFLHDGDNEDTRLLDKGLLGGLDALMLCPWQGSGWVEFIEAVKPRHWFIMHLDEEELDLQEKNLFLPELCDHVPQTPIALRPGQSYAIQGG